MARAKGLAIGVITQQTLDQRIATARSSEAQLAASRSALAVAEADKRSREAERRELMVRIGRTEVRAPVAGRVGKLEITVEATRPLDEWLKIFSIVSR